ncbi:C40 family peptidase [Gudongella oleilytica]|jgi:cell wall-associated NlpC family hydrolase|nr:C40 family peptidase [Gudongella oleilytica]
MVVGFKDSGILVQDYTALLNNGAAIELKEHEKVEVAKENDDSYIVYKEGEYLQIPKNTMIRTTRKSDKFTVSEEVELLSEPRKGSKTVRMLVPGEELIMASYDQDYGRFIATADFGIGYVRMDKIISNMVENISYGVSNISAIVRNDSSMIVLVKGETVGVVDYSEGKYTLVDEAGQKYKVDKTAVSLYNSFEQITRAADRTSSKQLTSLIKGAYSLIGKQYVYATSGPNTFDCSGLTYYLYKTHLGIVLPRSSYLQPGGGTKVEKSELRPGDLVFFNTTGSRISHVGLYIGDGNMIHASSTKGQVRIDTINSGWYYSRYVTAVRVIN